MVGLKREDVQLEGVLLSTFNRTMVGLKQFYNAITQGLLGEAFNRTMVGLKRRSEGQ